MPFFSIVIPTYNRSVQLLEGMQSVLSQSFRDFEMIIVDDGSTDDTASVVKKINDPRIRYYWKENEERSIARNYGIKRAKGKYINFLDSDDMLYPNHFQEAIKLIESKNYPETIHLGYELIDQKGKVIRRQDNFDDVFDKLIRENILHSNAMFIRRDVALAYSFIPSKYAIISEDWYLWLRLICRFPLHYSCTITSAIIEHEQRSLRSIDPSKLIRSTQVIIEHLNRDAIFLKRYGERVKYFYANMYTLITLVLALSKSKKHRVFYYLYQALRWDWRVIGRRRFLASIKHLL